jgi:hypothetical protein
VAVEAPLKSCVVCGVKAPETETDYTLISRKHAWRLERQTDASGRFEMVWYCPECWRQRPPPLAKPKGR